MPEFTWCDLFLRHISMTKLKNWIRTISATLGPKITVAAESRLGMKYFFGYVRAKKKNAMVVSDNTKGDCLILMRKYECLQVR
jgi:hypothetical protein